MQCAPPSRQGTHAPLEREHTMPMYVDVVAVPNLSTSYACLLFLVPVSAGYPSPADDYLDGSLDLNQHLIKHPTATFFVRVAGESMREAGIHSGDVLIVDRALIPGDGSVIIAIINGELTVKRLSKRQVVSLQLAGNSAAPKTGYNAPLAGW